MFRRAVKNRGVWMAGAAVVCATAVATSPRDVEPQPSAVVAAMTGMAERADVDPATAWNPNSVHEALGKLPRLYSLLVSRNGELIFERYYNGARANRHANIKSASKSVISTLVGIAIDKGLIPDTRTPIVKYFPELATATDPRKREITVEHLVTMRPGLDGTSGRNYGAWVTSRNWVRHALDRPMIDAPGEEMEYSTGTSHLLSAILTKATGKSTWQFANDVLARPLGSRFRNGRGIRRGFTSAETRC
jgi:CubicO group peptidase (beta-lactamase class C family)